ncbi:MAG: acyltransferase [Capsulimonas sp.]|uniref:acyltransferase family protein n=1 Tax=Capsulimonas sp. TaxID=2494211 RepID=UPI003265BC2F
MSTATLSRGTPSSQGLTPQTRPHLHFLDGIRGIAAFLVVVTHMWGHCFLRTGETAYPLWFRALSVFKYGHYLVAVFIVLSGFCLMLPAVMAGGVMKNGVVSYIKRRARRILPPYYAALAIAAGLMALFPMLRIDDGTIFSPYHRSDMAGSLVTHLLLIHNWIPHWTHRFDGPMWSVATEWQIYFVFPLMLLPLWRKWGAIAPIALGLALGFCTVGTILEDACFWYIGLFAMGMAACSYCFPGKTDTEVSRFWTWPRLWGVFAVVAVVMLGVARKSHHLMLPCTDVIAGVLAAYLLIYCTQKASAGESPLVLRFFSSRPVTMLGMFSYSLYLLHLPLLYIGKTLLMPHQYSAPINFLIYAVVGTPLILGITYAFHRIFERPFMNAPNPKAATAPTAAKALNNA